jgi:hypothetical protein
MSDPLRDMRNPQVLMERFAEVVTSLLNGFEVRGATDQHSLALLVMVVPEGKSIQGVTSLDGVNQLGVAINFCPRHGWEIDGLEQAAPHLND